MEIWRSTFLTPPGLTGIEDQKPREYYMIWWIKTEANFPPIVFRIKRLKSSVTPLQKRSYINLKLYSFLMKKKVGTRLFPKIKSDLYNQTPTQYVNRIIRISRKYPLMID